MSELYIKPAQDYIKQLCTEHVDVLHDDDTNVAFIRLYTAQDLAAIRNNACNFFVVVDNFIGRVKGSYEENKLRQELTLLFLKKVSKTPGDPFGAIEDAQEKALEVMFDFYERMKYDYETDDCGPLKYLDSTQMVFEPVPGPVEEEHYGWLMTIPFDVKLPAYDAAKWNSA